jgi:hypothetical protein
MPVLSDYEKQTQRLLNDTSQAEYNLADLDVYINMSRGQIAASTQCLRYTGTITTVGAQQSYPLANFSVATGIQSVLNIRLLSRRTTGMQRAFMEKRPWEWFFAFELCKNPPRPTGPPVVWSQEELGPTGSISFSPVPDTVYALDGDVVGIPVLLVDDTTFEAIPYPWTDAVPYFAAYFAYLNTQREADAQQMMMRAMQFFSYGNKQTVPTVLPGYEPGGRGAMEAAAKVTSIGTGMPQMPGQQRGGGQG